MTTTDAVAAYYDPYDGAINADPYPAFKALRDEAPVYYNDVHDFWALSRFEDIDRAIRNHETFISGRGGILELIKAGIEMPPGILIFEDPPSHTVHRRLLSRVFTPKRVAELEPKVREYCVQCLDPFVGEEEFDFIAHLGAQVPMKTISMLLGIPESDQEFIRDRVDASLRTEEGKPMEVRDDFVSGDMFAEYIDWRAEHPSDDLMTDLLQATFTDDKGELRSLSREEILTYVNVIAGAGNETTNRLIGWTGKTLADHPDPDRFDIHRDVGQMLTFGYGIHFCLGAALARMEGRVALEELLTRFPEWEVDEERSRLSPTSTVRGWETLPVRLGTS